MKKEFFKNLNKIGYAIKKNKDCLFATKAFQRRFRPQLINGIIDKECLIISKKILK